MLKSKFDRLPASLANVLATTSTPETLFNALMPALGDYLACDRCFLYLREPNTRLGRVPFYWVRHADIPTVYDEDWKLEPPSLPDDDPMFAAALRTEPSIVVDDVEAASADTLNKQFEQENFGHRALIHAHICCEGQLWGVLQPSVFGQPRHWTQTAQEAIDQVVQAITPSAVAYVKAAAKPPVTQ
ncbi:MULTISPECIES: GAF domain-containing protein [Cyanophyceae]|uniref:GAF domain-containing protein n=1 Tax=Stenomitos frigidus AS-A4 TaxID=2933935 RepID=A0ABV0KG89_9CYAN|nr:GAF domain-containing protein [Phormidium sp. FACHB-592]